MKLLVALSVAAVASAQHFGYGRSYGGGYGYGAPIRQGGISVGYQRPGARARATVAAPAAGVPVAAAPQADQQSGASHLSITDEDTTSRSDVALEHADSASGPEEDQFNLSQMRYKLDNSLAYKEANGFDAIAGLLDLDVDPAIKFINGQRYQDSYTYNIDRIQEAIDHYHQSGANDPHTLTSLQMSLDAEHHRVDAFRWFKYGALIPEVGDLQLGRHAMLQRRRVDHENAQYHLERAYDQFAKGEIDAEELWSAEHGVWVEAQEEAGTALRLLGSPSSVFGIPFVSTTSSKRRLADEALWEAEEAYYREPTRDNYESLIDAELGAEESKYTNLARIFQFLGNGVLSQWAWWQEGKMSQILNERKYDRLYENGAAGYHHGLNVDHGYHYGHGGGHLLNSAHYGDKNNEHLDRLMLVSYLGGRGGGNQ